MTPQELLDLPLDRNDADAANVREYLIALLREVWIGGEDFSGKRPFGNSGWYDEVYTPMVSAGLVDGELSEYGGLDRIDSLAADNLIVAAIEALGGAS